MTRRLLRFEDFELVLQIKNDGFIRPPRAAQRNWLLNSVLKEFAADLIALDRLAAGFMPGSERLPIHDRRQGELSDQQIMEDWQIPLMRALAEAVTTGHGALLEIGFGRGVAADFVQQFGVSSHTIIECNNAIVERCRDWRERYPDREVRVVPGRWQDVLGGLGRFDAILFHTYPLDEDEQIELIGASITFAEHFFPHAARHLRTGGAFTYMSNEIDSLSRAHQRLLLRHFAKIELSVVKDLPVPENVKDAWWTDTMVVVKAVK